MLAVVQTANADVASKGYVDDIVGAISTDVSASVSGTGNVITNVSADGDTITATKGITAEETKNKVTTIRDTATATDTAYPSEKAVATALEGKASSSDIPTVNNAVLTIQKNGSSVGTFSANASAATTINIAVPTTTSQLTNNSGFITSADLPEDYVLPVATSSALGGVKSGGNITVSTDGAVTVNSATKATQDASGNVITTTYATKTELSDKLGIAQGSGAANKAVITNASGNVTTGTISSAMITDGAVTSAKIADGTITNSDISATAKIATSKIDGLATVATSGSYDDLTDKPTIPEAITVDSALSSDSTNPVQNKVIKAELDKKLTNTATGTNAFSTGGATATIEDALAIGVRASAYGIESTAVGTSASVGDYSVAMGAYAQAERLSVAVGQSATAGDVSAVAIGETAIANGTGTIQLGGGVNDTPNTFSVGLGTGKNYKLLGSDGKIPSERMPNTIPVGSSTATTYATMWVE